MTYCIANLILNQRTFITKTMPTYIQQFFESDILFLSTPCWCNAKNLNENDVFESFHVSTQDVNHFSRFRNKLRNNGSNHIRIVDSSCPMRDVWYIILEKSLHPEFVTMSGSYSRSSMGRSSMGRSSMGTRSTEVYHSNGQLAVIVLVSYSKNLKILFNISSIQ